MTTKVSNQSRSTLLTKAIRADGVFALISSSVLLLGSRPVSDLIELDESGALLVLGVVLLGYATLLLLIAGREPEHIQIARAAVVLNLLWVLGSYAGLLLGWFPVNTAGKWAIALVAEAVFIFAVIEFYALMRSLKKA